MTASLALGLLLAAAPPSAPVAPAQGAITRTFEAIWADYVAADAAGDREKKVVAMRMQTSFL